MARDGGEGARDKAASRQDALFAHGAGPRSKDCAPGAKAKPLRLCEAKEGRRFRIVKVRGGGSIKQRLLDMGIAKGAEVRVVRFAPLMDPIEVNVRGYNLALRVAECSLIEVEPVSGPEVREDA
jgi:Fe2+ transport system protein FeoA